MKRLKLSLFFIFAVFLSSCSNEFEKNPVDELIKDLNEEKEFTIVLYDMDVEEAFFNTYKHQYQIITMKDTVPQETLSEWIEVSEALFEQHINDMGMELASKGADGKLIKEVAPAGYSNYVGNERYGQWSTDNSGNQMWTFFAQYMMLSTMFNMMSAPAYHSSYNTYRTGYYGTGTAYYGDTDANGRTRYGTASVQNTSRSNSRWVSKPSNSNFFNKVNTRTNRSGSRYNSGSSTRSRGGGVGK